MSAATVGSQIANALVALSDADKNDPVKIWQKVCELFIAHMAANAQITVAAGIAVTTPAGPGATSAPGMGTIA